MRVKELIEELKQYPDDYIVSVVDEDDFVLTSLVTSSMMMMNLV